MAGSEQLSSPTTGSSPPCSTPSSSSSHLSAHHPGHHSPHHNAAVVAAAAAYNSDKFVGGGPADFPPAAAATFEGSYPPDRNHNQLVPPGEGTGQCGRPGCGRPVNKAADGTSSTYCSSECVVGQCREVYSSWANQSPTCTQQVK